jgi:hypothetical protein
VQLAGSGYKENYLLDHPSINQCCRVWADIFHQRSDMGTIEDGPPDPTLHPKTTKRVLRCFPAIDFSLFVYTSRDEALADLALNFPGNKLLWEIAESGTATLAELARSALGEDLSALGPLADALEERGDSRGEEIRRWNTQLSQAATEQLRRTSG